MRLRTQIEETGEPQTLPVCSRPQTDPCSAMSAGISPLDVLPAALPGIKTYVDQCLRDRASAALPAALAPALNLGVPR